jgi:ElaB/YqjD/DUF883 family membrane-anchored ribosome-binding protein
MENDVTGHVENGHNPPHWKNPLTKENRDAVVDTVTNADRQVRAFIRENPAAVVLGAVAIGFLIGRLVRR